MGDWVLCRVLRSVRLSSAGGNLFVRETVEVLAVKLMLRDDELAAADEEEARASAMVA